MEPSIRVRHYRKAYLTVRLSVLGLSAKPKFGALVIFHPIGVLVIKLALW